MTSCSSSKVEPSWRRNVCQVPVGRPARWLLLTAPVLTGLLLGVLTLHQAAVWPGMHTMMGG